jgi:3-oxoadipate enol-lactonase
MSAVTGPHRSASGLDHYIHRGTGSGTGSGTAPVVALHPWFGCWQFWLPVLERFPERDWVLVDLYSGAETIAADDGAFAGLAAAVTDLVTEVTEGPVVLAGNSTGGLLAQTIAIVGTLPLEALVLVGTGASAEGVRAPFRATLGEWLGAKGDPDPALTATVVRALLHTTPDPETLATYTDAVTSADYPFLAAALRGVLAGDVTAGLPRIGVPTLVIRGEQDQARTPEHVRILCAGIPDCRSVEIAEAGHSPMVDQPAVFAAALRDFLDEVKRR